METEKPKIALYVRRSFGEKFNASFDFIKENWKLMLKYATYLLLPLCLVQALSLNGLMTYTLGLFGFLESGFPDSAILSFFAYYGLYMLLLIIGIVLLTALVYAMIRTYNEREERLQGVTLGMLRPMLLHNVKRMFILVFFGLVLTMLASLIIGVLAALFPETLFAIVMILFIPFMIAVAVPFSLWAPIYLLEDISIVDSLKKTFRLGFTTWGGIFMISLVMGFIAGILQSVTLIPWYIGTAVKYIFMTSSGGTEATVSVGYSFLLYLLAVVQVFGAYLAMIFSFVGLAYQYGHASEKVDSIMVESDIDNFDKL